MNTSDDELTSEYERLRRQAADLDKQAEAIDARLVEIEHRLPDDCT